MKDVITDAHQLPVVGAILLIRRFAPCFILKGEKQDVEDETPLV